MVLRVMAIGLHAVHELRQGNKKCCILVLQPNEARFPDHRAVAANNKELRGKWYTFLIMYYHAY